jgi:hypothetical protein
MSKQVGGMRVELGEWFGRIGLGRTGLDGVGREAGRQTQVKKLPAFFLSGLRLFLLYF